MGGMRRGEVGRGVLDRGPGRDGGGGRRRVEVPGGRWCHCVQAGVPVVIQQHTPALRELPEECGRRSGQGEGGGAGPGADMKRRVSGASMVPRRGVSRQAYLLPWGRAAAPDAPPDLAHGLDRGLDRGLDSRLDRGLIEG